MSLPAGNADIYCIVCAIDDQSLVTWTVAQSDILIANGHVRTMLHLHTHRRTRREDTLNVVPQRQSI